MSFEWLPLTQDWLRGNSVHYGPRNPFVSPRSIRNRSELKTKPAALSMDDMEDAALLVRPEQRLFLQRLIQVGKARSVDARQDISAETVEPLLARGLVNKEFLVVCRKDSSTLCTAQSKEEIEGVKFRCSNCGRAFSDEHVQEIYAPAPRAKELTDGSHWMTLWITHLLLTAGVEMSQIAWGATAGEDELDIVASINGVTVFFELKDREFGLGDAYPFSSRVQRYGGDVGVILSMDRVAEEVVKYLNEQRGPTIHALAGMGKIESDLRKVLEGIAVNAVLYSVSMLTARSRVDVKPLLQEWMRHRASRALPFGVPSL